MKVIWIVASCDPYHFCCWSISFCFYCQSGQVVTYNRPSIPDRYSLILPNAQNYYSLAPVPTFAKKTAYSAALPSFWFRLQGDRSSLTAKQKLTLETITAMQAAPELIFFISWVVNGIFELFSLNRSGGIWTHDPHYPKVVRYQAALRPDRLIKHIMLFCFCATIF